ncbi:MULTISPECIES: hypothetical protein [Streptomyces]|uniref:Uncharacterized protein n=1 Tax=Streptomyces dengpaensis TaxID=2049881 RepID=A0ABM6SRR0_9ACTN|nr:MULTISPECIES: hypothetical protein [Streptomyces]AVH57412.1 hypothetical protein C4B68_18365 [Streptomyces dengpaensis]PIB05540.1 hypothetical protein B1C81_28340 [Streptomyces sp. HG99]
MTFHSQFRRLLLLTASSSVIAAGVLLPSSAFAATTAPQTGIVATVGTADGSSGPNGSAASAARWVDTIDAKSGIRIQLPGKSDVQHFTEAKDGGDARLYMVDADYAIVGFAVFDAPGTAPAPDDDLKSFLDGFNKTRSPGDKLTTTGADESTIDGRPALDAALKSSNGLVGATRIIYDGDHVVLMVTIGSNENAKPLDKMHQHLLATLRMPHTSAAPTSEAPAAA